MSISVCGCSLTVVGVPVNFPVNTLPTASLFSWETGCTDSLRYPFLNQGETVKEETLPPIPFRYLIFAQISGIMLE